MGTFLRKTDDWQLHFADDGGWGKTRSGASLKVPLLIAVR